MVVVVVTLLLVDLAIPGTHRLVARLGTLQLAVDPAIPQQLVACLSLKPLPLVYLTTRSPMARVSPRHMDSRSLVVECLSPV